MKQVVVRVLWPQQQTELAQWQCEYSALPVSVDGEPTQILGLQDAFQRAAASQQAALVDVVLVLPAELALLDCVQLPARGQRQALQALPFVVEEQLARDIEDVHLAVGHRRADGRWPVLVVDLAIMASLFDQSEQAGLLLKGIYVDAQLLPGNEGELSVLLSGERVLLRAAQLMTALDLASAAGMIHLLTGDTAFSRVNIRHEADNEQQALLAQQLATEYIALGETQAQVDTFSGSLGQQLLAGAPAAINLLQGRFAVRQPAGRLPWWQIAAAVLVFGWLGQLGLQVTSGLYFNHWAVLFEKSAENDYRKLFPDARQVSTPRKRVENRLASGGDTGGVSFAWLFGNSVQALNSLPDHDGLVIEQLRYEGSRGQLELELKAKSIDQLDQYKQALGKLGLEGRISSANDSDGGISGRMQIGKGA